MLGLAARRTFGLTKASVPKRFSGAGYIMRPPKGWLDVVDTDFDHKEGPPRMSPEHRERIYLNQMKLYSREAIDLGADPDPQVRKERLKPKQRRRYDINKSQGKAANLRVRALVELIQYKREREIA